MQDYSRTSPTSKINLMKLEKATTSDIILSVIIPGWGFMIGLIALIKAEPKRGIHNAWNFNFNDFCYCSVPCLVDRPKPTLPIEMKSCGNRK
jgi:hypothetical protein